MKKKHFKTHHFKVPQSLTLNTSRDFFDTVVPYALIKTQEFLTSGSFILTDSPCLINNSEEHKPHEDQDYIKKANSLYYCDVCSLDIHSEEGYQKHLNGRRHMKKLEWHRKLQERTDKLPDHNRKQEANGQKTVDTETVWEDGQERAL